MWPNSDRRRGGGFTLVELMIAISLMLIITLQLNIIFNQSRQLFVAADAMVQVFQNARAALDTMERDIANIQKTSQMEFFKDDPQRFPYGNKIYNEGEELTGSAITPRFFDGINYVYGLALKQPKTYDPKERKEGNAYRRDALYFRGVTTIDGTPKDALVKYELYTGAQEANPLPRPILRRTLWEIEKIENNGDPRIRRHPDQDLCYYVQEFKAEAFLRDKRKNGMGRFYSAKEAARGGGAPTGDQNPPNLQRYGTGETFGIMCVARNEPGTYAQLSTAAPRPIPAGLPSDAPSANYLEIPNERLAGLTTGDKMYVIMKSDPGQSFREDFGGFLTIAKIDIGQGGTARVWFEEAALISQKLQKKKDDGFSKVDVDWRGAWLPPAIRVTMKVKDARSEEVRTIERIFHILKS